MKGKKLLVLSAIAILLVGCKPGNSSSQNPSTSAGTSSETISSNAPSTNSSSSSEAQQPSVSLPNIDSTGPSSVVQGQVGSLTSAMIETIANPSITVNGKLTDWYVDGDTNTTETTEYFSEVKMAQDAWSGAYWIQPAEGEKANVTTDATKKVQY
jgi:hypothetical protein